MIRLTSIRAKAVFKTASVNALAKIVTAAVQLAIVPIALGALGQELYGVWMAVAAMVAFLQFTDLGVANALIGLVGQASTEHKFIVAKQLLLRSLLLVGGLSILVGVFALFGVAELPWVRWLSIDADVSHEAIAAAQISIVMFCIGLVLSLVQQVRLGLLEGHISACFQIAGQVLNLAFVYLAAQLHAGLPLLVVASMLGLQLMQLFNLLALIKKLKGCAQVQESQTPVPDWSLWAVLQESAPFVIIQIMGLVTIQADILIVSHFLGADSVTTYSVTQRLFSMPELMIWVFLISLWPAYANAKAEGAWAWVKQTFNKSLRHLLILNGVIALVLFVVGAKIINIWTQGAVNPGSDLVAGMAVMIVVTTWSANLFALMNGLGMAKFQAGTVVVFGLVNLALSIYLTILFGISGPIWGTVVSRGLMSLFLQIRLQRHLDARLAWL